MTRIKVCGLTRVEDAALAAQLGAWALGFIFFEGSPRAVQADRVQAILKRVRKTAEIQAFGVFVNAELSTVVRLARESGVDTVQLHGNESPEFCLAVRSALPEIQQVKALRLRSRGDLTLISRFSACEAVLLDTYLDQAASWGGTGVENDFNLAREAVDTFQDRQVILSGGLSPENISRAIQAVRPFALDVSSGLESAPGVKCGEKLKAFFEKAGSLR